MPAAKLIAGVGTGSVSRRYGSADLDPDPHQNVTVEWDCAAHMELIEGKGPTFQHVLDWDGS